MPTSIYVVHTQGEAAAAESLDLFLRPQVRRGRISLDGSYKHSGGGYVPELVRHGIQGADIILLLVSARLLVECEEAIQLAMVRSKLGLTPVVPILLNHVILREGVLDGLVTLPRASTRRFMAEFRNQDEAWVNVSNGVLAVVDDLPARRERIRKNNERPDDATKVQMLFLAANPSDTGRLQLSHEFMKVRGRLESLGLLSRFEIHDKWNVDLGDLAAALLRHRPQVLHISAHSQPNGSLLMQGLQTEPAPLTGQGLCQLLSSLPQRPKLLVLNSCFAGCEAATLVEAVDTVIGFLDPVTDKDAIAFADILYMNLAQQRSVQQAFDQARGAVRAKTRVILQAKLGVDPAQLHLTVPKAP
jgi:hypothetical protein